MRSTWIRNKIKRGTRTDGAEETEQTEEKGGVYAGGIFDGDCDCRYSCQSFFCCGDSLPKKAPPSGDGSDGEGDLSGGAESSDTGGLQWNDSASAPDGGTGGIFRRSKAGKAGNFGRKYSAGGGEKGKYLRGSLCAGKTGRAA